MIAIIKSINALKYKFDCCVEEFAVEHPNIAFIAMFAAIPILVMLAVSLCTTVIVLPFAWLFGWL